MATKAGSSAEKLGFLGNYSWVIKVFASATSIVAGLVGFGFFSEAALYEMAGLPRLSADPVYLAEAGARALVSAIGAVGVEGGSVLLAALSGAFWLWSVKSREATKRLLQVPVLLLSAQVLVLAAAVVLLGSLVGVARMGTSAGRDQVAERAKQKIAELRDREDWTPTAELEAVEMLRIAPNRFAATSQDVGAKLRWVLPPWRDYPLKAQPSLGFPLRPTAELRREARDYFGWLAVGAILLPGAFVLLQRWRANIAARHLLALREFRVWRRRKKLEAGGEVPAIPDPEDPTAWGVGLARRETWAAYFEASRFLLEPVLIMLSVCCVGLIPSAHGVLAEESIGLQPVMVRLATEEGEKTKRQARACNAEVLKELADQIGRFRSAWQEVTLDRPGEIETYPNNLAAYREATDRLIELALNFHCAEAFRRLWLLTPEPSEFEAQPSVASYMVERFNESVVLDGFALYGHLLAPPRGEEKEQITLFTQVAEGRWSMQEVPRAQVSEILVLPREREGEVEDAVGVIRSAPVPTRLDDLMLFPGSYSLERALELLKSGYLPHGAQLRLITLVGVLGRVGTTESSPARERVVDHLTRVVADGLAAVSAADSVATGPKIDLAGAGATSLSNLGGPYAARSLAKLLADPKPTSFQIDAVPTLVTSAGRLASDLRESLILYPDRTDCKPDLGEYGPSFPKNCRSAEVTAQRDLIAFAARAAGDKELSLDVRTAACTGLGISLEPIAQNMAFGIGIAAIKSGDDVLAGHCLYHTPARLSEAQRRWLRAIARGQREVKTTSDALGEPADWEQHLVGTPGPSSMTAVPADLRIAALAELQEAGLWGEDELVFELLASAETGGVLDAVASMIEDVDPAAAVRAIRSCVGDPGRNEEQRLRCVAAAGRLHRTEEGDNGLVKETLWPLIREDSVEPKRIQAAACGATAALAARGGREASRLVKGNETTCDWLEAALQGETIDNSLDLLNQNGTTDRIPGTNPNAPAPTIETRRVAERALKVGDPERFMAAARSLAEAGDEEDLEWLASVARSEANESVAVGALGPLLAADRERWAPLAAELFLSKPASLLTLVAGEYLEDGAATAFEPGLLECVVAGGPRARRCAVGLALLSKSWRASAETRSALERALAAGNGEACRALAELAARGDGAARAKAGPSCPGVLSQLEGVEPQIRWSRHLLALMEVLQSEGVSPFSTEALEQKASELRQLLELVASLP